MAKRKRLTPAQVGFLDTGTAALAPAPAPIAHVAGEAAALSALSEVGAELEAARASGRLMERLPLDAIDPGHLVRDRIAQDDDEMAALIASIAARGQQTPIEVVALEAPEGGHTHGLVSGARRLAALKRLRADAPEESRFGHVLARVIRPESQEAAYVAMVEENEIRANLSHYERARIVLKAHREGVYPTQKEALKGLFGNVPRARRSKINSFIALVEQFDDVLAHPTAISEKLGLALVRALQDDAGFTRSLAARLGRTVRRTSEQEIAVLSAALKSRPAPDPSKAPAPDRVDLDFDRAAGVIRLSGPGVGPDLARRLKSWLAAR